MPFVRRGFESIVSTWLAGLLLLLPLVLTLALIGWIVSFLNGLIGPNTTLGRLFVAVGHPFVGNSLAAYGIGTLVLLVLLYPLGIAVKLGLRRPLAWFANLTFRRIPVFGKLYGLAERFVELLDRKEGGADIRAMSPVWCFFGGQGVAVLALLPNPAVVDIDGRHYHAVLVPSAPVPVGGGLLYVPVDWVKPADMGIDMFTSIYVSMGITLPPVVKDRQVEFIPLEEAVRRQQAQEGGTTEESPRPS